VQPVEAQIEDLPGLLPLFLAAGVERRPTCRRFAELAPRSAERRALIQETAAPHGISESSLYRAPRERGQPKALQRADCGVPRILPQSELERFCEVIAALKIRTSNKKGRGSVALAAEASARHKISSLARWALSYPGVTEMAPFQKTDQAADRVVVRSRHPPSLAVAANGAV
jgi:hypothetical protein